METNDNLKNRESQVSKAKADLERATEEFENDLFQGVLSSLSSGFRNDIDFIPLYELAAKCFEKLEAIEEADLFHKALKTPKKTESFREIGTHFYKVGHYDLALPFLEKAVEIDPSRSDTVHVLAIVYSRRFQINKAVKLIEKNIPQHDFWDFWLWCKLRILAGKTQGVRKDLNMLISVLDKEKNQDKVEIPKQKVEEVLEILLRYEQVIKPRTHIQDWHFIQYGDIILDYYESSDDDVAGGRYVAYWGTFDTIKPITVKLKTYIESLEINIEKIACLGDRDSKILGLIIGLELGLQAQKYDPDELNRNTLIVGANSFDFNDNEELSVIKDGQVLFALNHDWLNPSSISPDIVGFMSQSYNFPWNGGGINVIDFEKGLTERNIKDERSEEEIAKDVYNEKVEIELNKGQLEFYLSKKEYLKAIGSKVNKYRSCFMIESPVPGFYF